MGVTRCAVRAKALSVNRLPIRTILLGFCFLVGVSFLISYLSDLLGASPVLDARENIALAEGFASGSWPDSPFYRAVLYPFLLSLLMGMGLGPAFPWLASLIGLGLHFLNAFLVGRLAGKLWRSRVAVWFSGVIYACYPVALFFSVQILDITLGITFFLTTLIIACDCRSSNTPVEGPLRLGLAAFVLGLATLVRPNFVVCAPVLLFVPIVFSWRKRQTFLSFCFIIIGLGLALLPQGAANYIRGGEFRVLPWQGAFNLYAANKSGADGRYFEQSVLFSETAPGENTARRESEYLYRAGKGAEAPLNPSLINRYWRQKLLDEIYSEPLSWFGLIGRKVFYLIHNWEPYNNLSYSYHRERFPVLAWNPFGWTFLLALGSSAVIAAFPLSHRPVSRLLLTTGILYGLGVVAFYVSARFRLPLVPLLAVAAGGWAVFIEQSRRQSTQPSRFRLSVALVAVLGICLISLADFAGAYDRRPYIQDEILLSSVAFEIGDGETAFRIASQALEKGPTHPVAARLVLGGALLRTLQAERPLSDTEYQNIAQARELVGGEKGILGLVAGLSNWREGRLETARKIWRNSEMPLGEVLFQESGPEGSSGQTEDATTARHLLRNWTSSSEPHGSSFPGKEKIY